MKEPTTEELQANLKELTEQAKHVSSEERQEIIERLKSAEELVTNLNNNVEQWLKDNPE